MVKILLNGTQVIKVSENNQTLYIYLEYPEDEGRSIEDIMKYQLPYENKAFPFSHFFDYEKRRGVSEIRSDNGIETFNVYAHMNRGTPDYKKSEFEAIIKQKIAEEIELPPGYTVNFVDTQKDEVVDKISARVFYAYDLGGMLCKHCNHSPIKALQIAYPGEYTKLRNVRPEYLRKK